MYWFMMFCIGLACCTYILPMATLNVGARYFGMMLMPCASGGSLFHLHVADLQSVRNY